MAAVGQAGCSAGRRTAGQKLLEALNRLDEGAEVERKLANTGMNTYLRKRPKSGRSAR